ARPGHFRGVQQHFLRYLDDADVRALQAALSKVLAAESPPVEEARATV
ncbi:MAG: TetR family transcriptional regulator, partial [Chloroflexi bacterium]|nr:TetR family transcriptional regulator [Chloroflexota bacterium]